MKETSCDYRLGVRLVTQAPGMVVAGGLFHIDPQSSQREKAALINAYTVLYVITRAILSYFKNCAYCLQ